MKKTIYLTILVILSLGCFNKKSPIDKAYEITKKLKERKIGFVEDSFFSQEYYNSFPNAVNSLNLFHEVISKIEIDKKENTIIDTLKVKFNNPLLPKDSTTVFDCSVPIGIKLPSPVPEYYLFVRLVEHSNEYKIIAVDLRKTKNDFRINDIDIQENIRIESNEIIEYSFMYEGGHKEPTVFKALDIKAVNENPHNSKIDSLIWLINQSEIIKVQKETDTRRFIGDPELEVIHFKLSNNFNWTLFNLVSEEKDKKEKFYGDFELRYYRYLNTAATYWIKSNKKEAIKKIMLELCQTGENIRNKPKESIKLELGNK